MSGRVGIKFGVHEGLKVDGTHSVWSHSAVCDNGFHFALTARKSTLAATSQCLAEDPVCRTGWCLSCLPLSFIWTNEKLDNTPVNHDILMVEPILVPTLPVDLNALHKVVRLAQSRRICGTVAQNSEVFVDVDGDVDIVEPRRPE